MPQEALCLIGMGIPCHPVRVEPASRSPPSYWEPIEGSSRRLTRAHMDLFVLVPGKGNVT